MIKKRTVKDLRDTVNSALGSGAMPSAEVMKEHQETEKERNERFQARLRNNKTIVQAPPEPISRFDWFAGMAMQALIQNAGRGGRDDASFPPVEVVVLTEIAKVFAREMVKEEEA